MNGVDQREPQALGTIGQFAASAVVADGNDGALEAVVLAEMVKLIGSAENGQPVDAPPLQARIGIHEADDFERPHVGEDVEHNASVAAGTEYDAPGLARCLDGRTCC